MNLTDEVVRAATTEEEAAVNLVVALLNDRVKHMVAARLAPEGATRTDVDDISQRCLLALRLGLPGLERQCVAGLNAYLSGIVRKQVASYLQAHGRGPVVSLDSTVADFTQSGHLWEFVSIVGPSPRTELERAELRERAVAAMHSLPKYRRELVIMAFYDQLSTRDMADQIGSSRSEVARQLREALRDLRRAVTGASTLGGSSGLY